MAVKENDINMGQILLKFFAQVQKYGLVITLLVATNTLSFMMYSDSIKKSDKCLEQQITDLKTDRQKFVDVMNRVDEALRQNTRVIERNSNK